MTTKLSELLPALADQLADNTYWTERLRVLDDGSGAKNAKVHLAIVKKPYIELIFEGDKTIESRFSKNKVLPFESVKPCDIILFKKSGGEIEGVANAEKVDFYFLNEHRTAKIMQKILNDKICGTPEFWESKKYAKYCSFIWLNQVVRFSEGIPFKQTGQQAWIILNR